MHLRVKGTNLKVSEPTREMIEHEVRMALGRHVLAVDSVEITLEPAGPIHDPDVRLCSMRIETRQGTQLAAESHAADCARAAGLAARRLERRLERMRSLTAPRALPARRSNRR